MNIRNENIMKLRLQWMRENNAPFEDNLSRYADWIEKTLADCNVLTEISKRNYAAQLRRGTITSETTLGNFIDKMYEELMELVLSHELIDNSFDHSELADIALVCFALAEHAGIDLVKEMADKTEFNEKRND